MSIKRLLILLARFKSRAGGGSTLHRLPPLLVLSDRARGFDIDRQLALWPQAGAFIERTYGEEPKAKAAIRRDVVRLATCLPRQARSAKLDGLHWPQKHLGRRRKSAISRLYETTSAHSGLALAKAARLGLDAILVSTAFTSSSPSASKPLGALRLARLQAAFPAAKIYALGGITLKTARLLSRTGISGVALVSYQTRQYLEAES
jgi:thiamine-phosphate pyrophosphorylase